MRNGYLLDILVKLDAVKLTYLDLNLLLLNDHLRDFQSIFVHKKPENRQKQSKRGRIWSSLILLNSRQSYEKLKCDCLISCRKFVFADFERTRSRVSPNWNFFGTQIRTWIKG